MAIRRETKRVEGIVIKRSDYKDSDVMVDILSKEGRLSFLARGVKKPKSKNASSVSLLAKSDFSLFVGPNGGLSLQEGKILNAIDSGDDLEKAAALSIIAELSKKMTSDEEKTGETYSFLSKTLKEMQKGFDPLSATLLYFAYLLKKNGYGLNVCECVRCGSKRKIQGLSYKDGGFVCEEDLISESEKRDAYTLKVVRYSFLVPLEKVGDISFEKNTSIRLLREWAGNVDEWLGTKITSMQLLSVF